MGSLFEVKIFRKKFFHDAYFREAFFSTDFPVPQVHFSERKKYGKNFFTMPTLEGNFTAGKR